VEIIQRGGAGGVSVTNTEYLPVCLSVCVCVCRCACACMCATLTVLQCDVIVVVVVVVGRPTGLTTVQVEHGAHHKT